MGTSKSTIDREWWLTHQVGDAGRRAILGGCPLPTPVQVEIHPYSGKQAQPCTNNCMWCTRKCDRSKLLKEKARGIEPDRLIDLILSLKSSGIPEFALAGNSTEPLLYPQIDEVIKAIKQTGAACRLYSNFQLGDRILGVVDQLDDRDLIRVSLDAGCEQSYDATHRPSSNGAFNTVLRNVKNMLAARARAKGRFSVVITYLMNQLNVTNDEITFIMRWAAENEIDSVAFNRPLAPYGKEDFFPLSDEQVEQVGKFVNDTGQQLKSDTKFLFRCSAGVQAQKPFRTCHYWKMAVVLSSWGEFLPCTSTAVAEYSAPLGCFDINDDGFDFWAFWMDRKKWASIDLRRCPDARAQSSASTSGLRVVGEECSVRGCSGEGQPQ